MGEGRITKRAYTFVYRVESVEDLKDFADEGSGFRSELSTEDRLVLSRAKGLDEMAGTSIRPWNPAPQTSHAVAPGGSRDGPQAG